jgi:hypothetical protein
MVVKEESATEEKIPSETFRIPCLFVVLAKAPGLGISHGP